MSVIIRHTGAVAQTGTTPGEIYQSMFGHDGSPDKYVFRDGKERLAYLVAEPRPSKLFDMARTAVEPLFAAATGPVDYVIVGSSSDSYSARENEWTDAEQVPSIARKLAAEYSIPKFGQLGTACSASSQAIITGADLIESGIADRVIVGGVDEVTASSIDGFDACRIYDDLCRPFSAERKGLVLGDGAAFMLLERDVGQESVGSIRGLGMASDGYHMVSMHERGVMSAMRQAVQRQAKLNMVDFTVAHGTGTQANDEIESAALDRFFSANMRSVASYKGALGHVQGASGAMGCVLALQSMRERLLFPSVGSYPVDENLAIRWWVAEQATPLPISRRLNSLVLSHGTWGSYTAIVLESAK